MSVSELEESLGFSLGNNYVVGTFHPVTLESATAENQVQELLSALDKHTEITYLFTKANADTDGRIINKLLTDYSNTHENFHLVDSLGMKRYLNAIKHSRFVIGNSSSGLIEVPAFNIPTINIGNRQLGRIAGKTVINCQPTRESIGQAIDNALNKTFLNEIKDIPNPYGDGQTSKRIMDIIKDCFVNNKINIKKKFYDLNFEV